MTKICPFCGSSTYIRMYDTGVVFLYKVTCPKGHTFEISFITPKDAESDYNTRPQMNEIKSIALHLQSAIKNNLQVESQYQTALNKIIHICEQ